MNVITSRTSNIIKAVDTEQRIALEVVYPAYTVDAHGDYAKPEALAGLVKALNELPDNFEYNIHHSDELITTGFSILKAYQNDEDITIESSGEVVPAGSALAEIHYADEELWDMRKSGILAGLSIGCTGKTTDEHEVDF